MKKLLKLTLSAFVIVCSFQRAYSQSTTSGFGLLGHTGINVANDWCGWAANTRIPFNLEHRGTQNINLLTDRTQRMTIMGSAAGATAGFVGIGNGFVAPLSVLHVNATNNATGEVLRTDCAAASNTFWRMLRGGIEYGNVFNNSNNFSIQASVADITWHTRPLVSGIGTERMRVVGVANTLYAPNPVTSYPVRAGNVGIGTDSPVSMLHIGGTTNVSGGYRDWMDIGTYYYGNSDNMYVGLKIIAPDRTDAVVSWGNNPSSNPGIGDRMRFIFAAATAAANGTSALRDGVELGHFWTDGTNSRMGLGDLQTAGVDPQNTLEIRSSASSPTPSGLRFTNLTAVSPTVVNPGTGVLSVNTNGDVILVPGGSKTTGSGGATAQSGCFINANGSVELGTNPLLHSTDIPLNQQTFRFINPSGTYAPLEVDIFPSSGIAINAEAASYGGYFTGGVAGAIGTTNATSTSPNQIGLIGLVGNAINGGGYIGVEGDVQKSNSGENFGMVARVQGSTTNNYGLYNTTTSTSGITPNNNFGVFSKVINATHNYGGYFEVNSDNPTDNIGVFAYVNSTSVTTNNIAIWGNAGNTNPNHFAGLFDGNVTVNGQINGVTVGSSDAKLKQNIAPLTNALAIIKQLKPSTFNYKTSTYPQFNFSAQKQYGFIAQEVETVLPELISNNIQPAKFDSTGKEVQPQVAYKGVAYHEFIPILMQGIKEQQAQIDSLKAAIVAMQNNQNTINRNNRITANAETSTTSMPNMDLAQNTPNPFERYTSINYTLEQAGMVVLQIFSTTGVQVALLVSENQITGKYSVTWDAGNLNSGMYIYTLQQNGVQLYKKAILKK